MKPQRYFAAAKKNDTLELLIYDAIGADYFGEGFVAKDLKAKLDEAGDVAKIVMRINSPGGSVFEGSAIYSLLAQHPAKKECYVDGIAASAAFTIAMAADTIHVSESAMMMCHNAWGICIGDAKEMLATAGTLEKINTTMRDIYAARCGHSVEEVQQWMDAETYMTAQECVDKGFASDVIKREPKEDAAAKALAASFDLSKYGAKKAPKVETPPEPPPEASTGDTTDCACDCAACQGGDCANCTCPDCECANCECEQSMSGAVAADQQARERHMRLMELRS